LSDQIDLGFILNIKRPTQIFTGLGVLAQFIALL